MKKIAVINYNIHEKEFMMKLKNIIILLATTLAIALPTVGMTKDTKKTSVSSAVQLEPKPTPKPAAPRPALYSGPDYDNVLGLGNYLVGK